MSEDTRRQSANSILMIRPAAFGFNPQTAGSNTFQTRPSGPEARGLDVRALGEFDHLSRRLRLRGLEVIVVPDRPEPSTPDAVFPNNWVSFHPDGTVVLYPMYARVRRLERRNDVLESLSRLHGFRISRILDLTSYEAEARFLEGTGSIVYDHLNRSAYASVSLRTDARLVRELAGVLGYDPVVFHATDWQGRAVYHTNVVMSLGTGFALVCAEAIADEKERTMVVEQLKATQRSLILIDRWQMSRFGANVLELEDREGARLVAMSSGAHRALRTEQVMALEEHVHVVSSPIPTIEAVGGGSVRCMIAEVFLPKP